MLLPHDCKYNICSGRRNVLMSEESINNCGVNNTLCRGMIVHIGKISRYFLMCLWIRVMSVFFTPPSYMDVWDNHFFSKVLNSRNKLKYFNGNTLVWQ